MAMPRTRAAREAELEGRFRGTSGRRGYGTKTAKHRKAPAPHANTAAGPRTPAPTGPTSTIPAGARCLVVEDTLHEYHTTAAVLRNFARFVPEGGFFVVEDGIVDDPQLRPPGMPGGVVPAVADWLTTDEGSAFETRRDLGLYGITSHPHGWLQRTATSR